MFKNCLMILLNNAMYTCVNYKIKNKFILAILPFLNCSALQLLVEQRKVGIHTRGEGRSRGAAVAQRRVSDPDKNEGVVHIEWQPYAECQSPCGEEGPPHTGVTWSTLEQEWHKGHKSEPKQGDHVQGQPGVGVKAQAR